MKFSKWLSVYRLMFSIAVIVGLLAPGIYLLVWGQSNKIYSYKEGRAINQFPAITFTKFIDGVFQTKFNDAWNDQFPFRHHWLNIANGIDRAFISGVYQLVSPKLIPADMSTNIFIEKDRGFLFSAPEVVSLDLIDARIENFNAIMSENEEINFNFFYIEKLENSDSAYIERYFHNSGRGIGNEYFSTHLLPTANWEYFETNTVEKHLENFFLTDHHWNIHGAVNGYSMIYNMLSKNYPDISPMVDIENYHTFNELEFLGSYARRSSYPITGEKFEVAIYQLPEFKIYDDVENRIQPGNASAYFDGAISNVEYQNHFGGYYGTRNGFLHYVFEGQPERNLLVIGSSYIKPIRPLLASHYTNTYFIDLRAYDFSFSEFIETYPVEDVLIFGSSEVFFSLGEWYIQP